MKKLIGTVVLAAMVAGAAFAELSVGAWLRTVWAPINSDGDETIYGGMANSWADGPRWSRLNFGMTSEDGKAGLELDVYNNDGALDAGDEYRIWVKPIDMLTVSFGKKDNGDFLAALCYGSWNWLRPMNALAWGEEIAFGKACNQEGALLELTPIEGLLVSWNLPYSSIASAEAYKAFEGQHIGVRYTIEGIGTVKAAWKGNGGRYHEIDAPAASGDEYKYLGDIGLAFELSAVENLNVVVGATIKIADSDYKKHYAADANNNGVAFKNAQFGLGASYAVMDNFTVYADFGMAFYEDLDDPAMNFGVGLDYGLMDGLTLNADFRGLMLNNDLDPSFSFLVGVDYACSSNGSIGIGFQGLIAGENSGMGKYWTPVFQAKSDKFSFAVPVKMQVTF